MLTGAAIGAFGSIALLLPLWIGGVRNEGWYILVFPAALGAASFVGAAVIVRKVGRQIAIMRTLKQLGEPRLEAPGKPLTDIKPAHLINGVREEPEGEN
jgi:hypothetical protein